METVKRSINLLPIGGYLALLLMVQGCEQKAAEQETSSTAQVASLEASEPFKPLEPVGSVKGSASFEKFLHHFQDGIPWQDWAVLGRRSSAFGKNAVGNVKLLAQDLQRDHIHIPRAYLQFFNLDFLHEPCKPWYAYTYKHPKPEEDFEFYGFAKQRMSGFWLVSCFALHSVAEDKNYHHEAFLSTFSFEGAPIASYAWWGIEDAEIQAMADVVMAGDTIVEGHGQYGQEGVPLESIHRKILIRPTGHFQIVQEYVPDLDSPSDMDPEVWPCR